MNVDEGAYLQPRLSSSNKYGPCLSHSTTDQQRHEYISTVTEVSLKRVHASGGIPRVKRQPGKITPYRVKLSLAACLISLES